MSHATRVDSGKGLVVYPVAPGPLGGWSSLYKPCMPCADPQPPNTHRHGPQAWLSFLFGSSRHKASHIGGRIKHSAVGLLGKRMSGSWSLHSPGPCSCASSLCCLRPVSHRGDPRRCVTALQRTVDPSSGNRLVTERQHKLFITVKNQDHLDNCEEVMG